MGNEAKGSSVFVSYAHENNEFREQVKQLCLWLRSQGVNIVCDFDHEIRPPDKGWPTWMQHGIEDAQVVLVIASPKYKLRFEKRADPSAGKGVAWEGAIITQDLYSAAQRNNKFYPILPDGESADDVPQALLPWHNNHRFPSGREGILALINECLGAAAKNNEMGNEREAAEEQEVDDKAIQKIIGRLEDVQDLPFLSSLFQELKQRLKLNFQPSKLNELVANLQTTQDKELLQDWIYAIREALEMQHQTSANWDLQWQAASGLFYLVAQQQIRHPEHDTAQSGWLIKTGKLSSGEVADVIGAVIAASLLGGLLEFKGTGKDRKNENTPFISIIGANADWTEYSIDRGLYKAWFKNRSDASLVSEGTGPLSTKEQSDLRKSIAQAKKQKHKTVAFIIDGDQLGISAIGNTVARLNLNVHMLWKNSELGKSIFGVEPEDLLADIQLFWDIDTKARSHTNTSTTNQGNTTMTQTPAPNITITNNNFNNQGGVAQTSGDYSHASISKTGIDHAALAPLLAALKTQIDTFSNSSAVEDCKMHLNEVDQELNAAEPNKSKIKAGLETIQKIAGYIGDGEKIVDTVGSIFTALSSFLQP